MPTCTFLDFWPAPEAHKPIHIDGMAAAAEPPAMEWHKSKGKMQDASLIQAPAEDEDEDEDEDAIDEDEYVA